jgi:ribonuclease HI
MAKKQKFYVVWQGKTPGIYEKWSDCEAQVKGVEGAKYKSFETKAEAQAAFRGNVWDFIGKNAPANQPTIVVPSKDAPVIWESICVDAACSGNPGDMEYRGVETKTGKELFRVGPLPEGTNNIGEFLGLVHGISYLQKLGLHTMPIYTDSKTGMAWLRNKKSKTILPRTARNKKVFELLDRAEAWVKANTYTNPIYKWETEDWGEIPADFGRK